MALKEHNSLRWTKEKNKMAEQFNLLDANAFGRLLEYEIEGYKRQIENHTEGAEHHRKVRESADDKFKCEFIKIREYKIKWFLKTYLNSNRVLNT